MALSQEEKEIVRRLKREGKTNTEIAGFIGGERTGRPSSIGLDSSEPQEQSFLQEAGGDLQEMREGFGEDVARRRENVAETREATAAGEQTRAEGAFQNIGQVVGTAGDALMRGVTGIGKVLVGQDTEDRVSDAARPVLESIAQSETVQEAQQKWQTFSEKNPRAARNVSALFNVGEVAAEAGGAGLVSRGVRAGGRAAREGVESAAGKISSVFPEGRTFNSIDEAMGHADEVVNSRRALDTDTQRTTDANGEFSEARRQAEEELPELNFQERWVDLDPAVKKRLQSIHSRDANKVQNYIDITKTANASDEAIPVMQYAGNQVRRAEKELGDILSDTGSEIGEARRKFADVEAPITQIENIENTFRNQLDDLNLEIRNGQVTQKSGTVTKVGSQNDVSVVNGLYQDLLATKQAPKLQNLIDLRNAFDKRINFSKSAQEVSNSVDPLSRSVRQEIADSMNNVVGKENASQVERYADVINAQQTLQDFTSRRAGAEYLVRLVTSGRGGEARKIMDTVRDITGIDLMDDAQLLSVMNSRFANDAQQTLFRQQIKNAGIDLVEDVTGAARGDMSGIVRLLQRGVDKTIDEEQVILDAARSSQ